MLSHLFRVSLSKCSWMVSCRNIYCISRTYYGEHNKIIYIKEKSGRRWVVLKIDIKIIFARLLWTLSDNLSIGLCYNINSLFCIHFDIRRAHNKRPHQIVELTENKKETKKNKIEITFLSEPVQTPSHHRLLLLFPPLHFRNKMELRSEFFMLFLLLSCCFRSSHFTGLRCAQPLTLTLITIIFNHLRDKN